MSENLALQPCTLYPYTQHAREGTEQLVTQQWLYDSKILHQAHIRAKKQNITRRGHWPNITSNSGKADMLLDIARLANGLRGLEPNDVSQLFLMSSQAAEWEPQATRRSRSHRRNHHYLSHLLAVENINGARLSTGDTQQDLDRLLTICWGSKGFLWSLLRKASFVLKDSEHGIGYSKACKMM